MVEDKLDVHPEKPSRSTKLVNSAKRVTGEYICIYNFSTKHWCFNCRKGKGERTQNQGAKKMKTQFLQTQEVLS